MRVRAHQIRSLASEHGFQLAGVVPALPLEAEAAQYQRWAKQGFAGTMRYLTDHRGDLRSDPRTLLASAKSIICVARLYNTPESGTIARYARTADYHDTIRHDLEIFVAKLQQTLGAPFRHKICVDTAPLLERSYARQAGLGWIGRNTCLISQELGSYTFLAEVLTSLDIDTDEQPAAPAPDRCGTCTRCIDACPTTALIPGGLRTELDATRCISYLTIEHRGDIPYDLRDQLGNLSFGCDICQEVCPWNRRAPFASEEPSAQLETLAAMTPDEFRQAFRHTPVWRTKYQGMMRNAAIAMGNSGDPRYTAALERLAQSQDEIVRSHAEWALSRIPQETLA